MAGIGEASAVIGVVQIGFSLARTLSTYIGDYKDSQDSIISLAVQLETTILHVKQLNTLIRSKEAAGSVSEDSRKVAENAVTNSKRLIEKLVKLLTKADLPDNPDAIVNIKPGDINVRTITKFTWPLIKPEVDVINLELQSMKTEILLARSCIQAQTGSTPAARAEGEESIVAFTKSKLLARRLLKEAKAEEKRAAMSAQQHDYVPRPPSGRPSPQYPSDLYRLGTYDGPSDDGKETDLMARDLRESILEDLQRKDAERKAKEKAEEAARKLAIEDYQKMVKEKLTRLQQATNTTQQRLKENFGPHLDEKSVQKFLNEQQSGQMQDEFGETLLKIGVMPSLPPVDLARDAGEGSTGKNGVRKPKRRWFLKRRPSHTSESTNMSNNATNNMTSGLHPSEYTRFLHIVMSYDSAEGKYSWQTLDNPALRHQPCGSTCDFDDTLRAWQALPRSVKLAASRWVDDNFSHKKWHLHAALPIRKDIRVTRRLLQKAVLGAVAHQGLASIMLVFSSTQRYDTSETRSTTAAGDSVSESSNTSASMSDGGASRVELSQTDIEQMRDWLASRGLSTAKIAGLEALVVKQKESAPAAAATQAPMPYDQSSPQDNNTGHDQADATVQADISRQGSGSHVRFVAGDIAPSTRHKSSASTVAPRGIDPYDRKYAEPMSRQPEFYRASGTRGGLRQGYREISPPSPSGPPPPSFRYDDDLRPPHPRRLNERASEATRFLSDDEWYRGPRRRSSYRVDDKGYRVDSLQSAYDRRDPGEPNRTWAEDEWETQNRRPQTHRQRTHRHSAGVLDPSYGGNQYGVRTRTNDYVPKYANAYKEEPRQHLPQPPPFSSRDYGSGFNYESAGVAPDHRRHRSRRSRSRSHSRHSRSRSRRPRSRSRRLRSHSRRSRSLERSRSRSREGSNTGLRSRGRRRGSEIYVSDGHEYIKPPKGPERSLDNIIHIRKEAESAAGDPNAQSRREHGLYRTGHGGHGRQETSPRPVQIIKRSQPAHQERQEITIEPYRPYNDCSPYRRIYPDMSLTSRNVYPGILSLPGQLSPKPLLDDVSDAEDAALDDAELKNKMLVKYTGGIVVNTPARPDRTADKPQGLAEENDSKVAEENAVDAGAEIDDEDAQCDARKKKVGLDVAPGPALSADEPASPGSQTSGPCIPTSPIPGVQRRHTATVDDYDSDAEAGTRRQRTRSSRHRPTTSPSSASSARDSPVVGSSPLGPGATRDLPDRDTVEEVG